MERLTERFENIAVISECGSTMCEEICAETGDCSICPISKAIDKLAEYEDMEEQGRLVKLPCKIGDDAFHFINTDNGTAIEDDKVRGFHITPENGVMIEFEVKWIDSSISTIGRKLFFTREQAEQALKTLKQEQS